VYDPGGVSNNSTFSGATQASSDNITGHSDTPSMPLPFDDDANRSYICSYTGNAARFDTGISSTSDHRFVHDPGREDFNGSIEDTLAHDKDADCSSDSHIVCNPSGIGFSKDSALGGINDGNGSSLPYDPGGNPFIHSKHKLTAAAAMV